MYVYTITFTENIMVEKARQGLLLFLEVFYDSTKAMICPISGTNDSGTSDSDILFFADGVQAQRHTMVETLIEVHESKLLRFVEIINNILNQSIIDKIKLQYIRTEK